MSIFGDILHAITGHEAGAAPASTTGGQETAFNVASLLDEKQKAASEPLNWRNSIVDLMKLLQLDSSLKAREALAKELGYTSSTENTAAMNIWLHRQVMTRLAAHGGTVPDELKHA